MKKRFLIIKELLKKDMVSNKTVLLLFLLVRKKLFFFVLSQFKRKHNKARQFSICKTDIYLRKNLFIQKIYMKANKYLSMITIRHNTLWHPYETILHDSQKISY